jgi:methylamine---glutamate N-methyltransferase subunit A
MCGIIGLFLKDKTLSERLGDMFAPMLDCMGNRGPDSAGFALYGDVVPEGCIKVTLRHASMEHDWKKLANKLQDQLDGQVDFVTNGNYAIFKLRAEQSEVQKLLPELDAGVRIMSVGRSIEILKEVGSPHSIADRFGVRKMRGTHIIGHTRMATESAVTTDGSHPFSTGMDLCLVHNGSLSNHNRLRRQLVRDGIDIRTENDSEVAAGYLMWQMQKKRSLQEAMESAIGDLDGFYTFAVGTADGFAVLRDPIACKPAVIVETDGYVGMASEYQALAHLPGIDGANIWEPKPGTVYTWTQN